MTDQADGALAGIRVLDLSRFIAGPYCTMMLGDMGADVVRIEPPGRPEHTRHVGPGVDGQSYYFLALNRNKRAIAIDLRTAVGRQRFLDLIARTDVLVENFVPRTLEAMELAPEQLHAANPRLIIARISGFGQDGPYADRRCYDSVAQAMSGLMSLTGDPAGPPMLTGAFICDYSTGLYALSGILAALQARHRTGRGQVVDASLLDSAVSFLLTAIPQAVRDKDVLTRNGNRDRFSTPAGTFQAADGRWVLISAGDDRMFPRLCQAMGRPDLAADPELADLRGRQLRQDELEQALAQWTGQLPADSVVSQLDAHAVPCSVVATVADVVVDPHLVQRGQILSVDQPGVGAIPMAGVTVRLSDTPLRVTRPVPDAGQHTNEVFAEWLGATAGPPQYQSPEEAM
ncbi:CaiB/BaiF CoA transferase family protein [Dactylosporangium cerinum]|uniref:CaiB/BaiF CoA transferase family protein n=1 Tax=Dactylosporangium cerinum TaxID=1434730 RepID=A0ABV9VWI9_9ACTN